MQFGIQFGFPYVSSLALLFADRHLRFLEKFAIGQVDGRMLELRRKPLEAGHKSHHFVAQPV